MERVEYDPEIDPSIREAREAAERERELSARIRLEIERYVADNDLVPRAEARKTTPIPPPWETEPDTDDTSEARPKTKRQAKKEAQRAKDEAKEVAREARRRQRAATAASRRKAVTSVFTGSILGGEWMRRMRFYLLGIAVILALYIACNFQAQTLHLRRQEREVRELGIEAVERTAERVRQTRRSAIVERLRAKEIPLEEFPHPVKRIER